MKAIESRRNPQNPKFRQWKVIDDKETVKITKSREGQATSSGKVKSDDFEKIQNSMQGLELSDDMFLGNLSANFGMDHDADLLALGDATSGEEEDDDRPLVEPAEEDEEPTKTKVPDYSPTPHIPAQCCKCTNPPSPHITRRSRARSLQAAQGAGPARQAKAKQVARMQVGRKRACRPKRKLSP